jgi:predicted nucleotide-binding protein (sugar kinase/HSP70/actin superfamily)
MVIVNKSIVKLFQLQKYPILIIDSVNFSTLSRFRKKKSFSYFRNRYRFSMFVIRSNVKVY